MGELIWVRISAFFLILAKISVISIKNVISKHAVKYRTMEHFILVFTVYESTPLGFPFLNGLLSSIATSKRFIMMYSSCDTLSRYRRLMSSGDVEAMHFASINQTDTMIV